ncbi:hypothetical protein AGMMS49574_03530 [Bacteroidia bacterium]|nr:hypothetical protein AGMMS49574_03530 [Bacteroidia bacterium]
MATNNEGESKYNLFFDKIKPIVEFIVIIGGLIIGLIELSSLSSQIEEQNTWNKKDVTFQYLGEYSDEMNMFANRLKKLPDTIILDDELKDDEFRNNLMQLVAYFDNLAIGIERNYFDERIVQESFIPEILAIYDVLQKFKYFELRKKEMRTEVAVHFRNLVTKWKN